MQIGVCFWTLAIVLFLSRTPFCGFYLKTETESSLRNVVFLNKNRTVANVQKHSICINVPLSQTVKSSLVNKSVAFYETRWFISVFTWTPHWTLSWAGWTVSTHLHRISLRFMLLFSHLRLGLVCSLFHVFIRKLGMHFSLLLCHADSLSWLRDQIRIQVGGGGWGWRSCCTGRCQ
jgi:hypothetical protein